MPQQPTHTLRLVLGDQLNPQHSWFSQTDAGTVYLLMEVRSETDYVLHHAQKVLAIFAAMRAFAAEIKAAGHRVRYVALDDPSNRQHIADNLHALQQHYGAQRIEYQHPDEWRLDQVLQQCGHGVDSEHFLTERGDALRFFGQRKQWRMELYYRHLRQRHGLLMDANGHPEGGQWNYDTENRKAWKGQPPEPADKRHHHNHTDLWEMLCKAGVRTFGKPNAEDFRWPLNRHEALLQLTHFITHALPHFGDYQDAMSQHAPRLFHSQLSFALNTKMLHPLEVIEAAQTAYRNGHAPLAAAEGFIRQILGWREYVRGIYWAHMPGYVQRNALQHHHPLPAWFWTGQTRMHCMAHAIGASLEHAHAHHIQRLMVISNFALLAGLSPQAVHAWYLGVYIDAFEWVELPNTLGMGQFADGGLLASKPYVSSGAYIARMGDYCRECPYNAKARTGIDACPFNALYWDFMERHRTLLQRNPRIAVVYRQLDRFSPAERQALQQQAETMRQHLDEL